MEKTPKPPAGLYPEETELFSFTARSTGETIWLPKYFEQPTAVWIWELYDKPFHVQTWEWMKLAKVPKVMQRKVVAVMDADPSEYMDLFNSWLTEAQGATAGE